MLERPTALLQWVPRLKSTPSLEHSGGKRGQLGMSRHTKGYQGIYFPLQIRALCSEERMFRLVTGRSQIGVPTVPPTLRTFNKGRMIPEHYQVRTTLLFFVLVLAFSHPIYYLPTFYFSFYLDVTHIRG